MISVELKVVGGKHDGQIIPLNRKKFLIGREADCHLRPNSELVSRHHCVFTVDDFSVRLRDLGSTNGTLVNGERIRKDVGLHPGDHVRVGSLEFEIVINEVSDVSSSDRISPKAEETVVGSGDTLTELPVETPNTKMPAEEAAEAAPPPEAAAATTDVSAESPAPATPAAGTPPVEFAPPPTGGVGDTTVIAQPAIMPGQMPYQPMGQQPMGYPPMYGGFPYPGMPPQYPMFQQPYPAPTQPGFTQQIPVPQPAAPQPAAPPEDGSTRTADGLNISLPDPATTGAKPPEPKVEKPAGEANKDDVPSNQSAAEIIQQQRNRRPGG